MRSLLIAGFFALLLFSTLPAFYILNNTASGAEETPITLRNAKVVYDMPYPGLLPDHPLYFLKIVRDRVTEFLTRDNIKKSKLYLDYSDKRVVMAVSLAEKGKNQMALTTLSKAEKYFEKIPDLLKASKNQGTSPPADLVLKLKLSNEKHLEVTQDLMESFPAGEKDTFRDILRINSEVDQKLQSL